MKTKSLLAALLAGCLFFTPVLLHAQISNNNPFNSSSTPTNDNSFNSSSTNVSTSTSTNLSTGNSFNSGYNHNQYYKCDYGHWHPCSLDDGYHHCPYHNSVPFDGVLGISLLLGAAILFSVKRKMNIATV